MYRYKVWNDAGVIRYIVEKYENYSWREFVTDYVFASGWFAPHPKPKHYAIVQTRIDDVIKWDKKKEEAEWVEVE